MGTRDRQVCKEYEELIISRAANPIESPFAINLHVVDWEDQPSRFKVYDGVVRVALSHKVPSDLGSLSEGALAATGDRARYLSYEHISALLLLSNGLLRRKLDINWSMDHDERTHYAEASWGRPAASGGGMYPFEIYLVTGRDSWLLPGIYHYDPAHHALERLVLGDATPLVRAATFGHRSAERSDQFILISLNFWKNYFKYHNFCYHVVTQDLGAELGAIRLAANALGVISTILLWFNDARLNELLGLETLSESVFAVVPLQSGPADRHTGEERNGSTDGVSDAERVSVGGPLVDKKYFQRSKRVFRLPLLEEVHQSALVQDEPLPPASLVSMSCCERLAGSGEVVKLPPAASQLSSRHLLDLVLCRASSFGHLTSYPRLDLQDLGTILRFAYAGQYYPCDVKRDLPEQRFTRLMVIASHVQDLPAGIYSFDGASDCLIGTRSSEVSAQLQRLYFLQNYNLEQAAAILVIVADLEQMFQVFGNRAARIYNAEVGLLAQYVYMSAAALTTGCGAILGFDNLALNQMLGLEGSGQSSLLMLLVGNQRKFGFFDYKIV